MQGQLNAWITSENKYSVRHPTIFFETRQGGILQGIILKPSLFFLRKFVQKSLPNGLWFAINLFSVVVVVVVVVVDLD